MFKYGINKNSELRLITELNSYKSPFVKETKFQPVTIGFKTSLIETKGIIPHISFLGHLTLFSKDDTNKNRSVPEFKFLFDHELSETLSLGYNLGMKWDHNLNENYTYTFTIVKEISSKMSAFVETTDL